MPPNSARIPSRGVSSACCTTSTTRNSPTPSTRPPMVIRRGARRSHRVLYPGAPPRGTLAGPRGGRVNPFSHALDRATGARPIPGNLVRHIAVSSDALDAMLEMITSAERTVHFENYIIHHDATGKRFAAAWADRARAGVRVRIL